MQQCHFPLLHFMPPLHAVLHIRIEAGMSSPDSHDLFGPLLQPPSELQLMKLSFAHANSSVHVTKMAHLPWQCTAPMIAVTALAKVYYFAKAAAFPKWLLSTHACIMTVNTYTAGFLMAFLVPKFWQPNKNVKSWPVKIISGWKPYPRWSRQERALNSFMTCHSWNMQFKRATFALDLCSKLNSLLLQKHCAKCLLNMDIVKWIMTAPALYHTGNSLVLSSFTPWIPCFKLLFIINFIGCLIPEGLMATFFSNLVFPSTISFWKFEIV